MDIIHTLLAIPYVSGGREPDGVDCWGLARLLRCALRGDWLPRYAGLEPQDTSAITQATRQMLTGAWVLCEPVVGALATVWRAGICRHVGIVIEVEGRLAVMDTLQSTGPRWRFQADFEAQYREVRYYDAA